MRSSSRRQSPARSSITRNMRGESTSASLRQDSWQLSAQKAQPLPYCDAALQQESADLIDDGGALADQSLAHAVQRLQIELLGSLGCDELHRRALHRLGDRLRIAEVVLLPLRIRAHVLRR